MRITGIAAGLHALLELPGGQGLSSYRAAEQQHGPALVVGYGKPPEHAFTAAVARLTAVLAEAAGGAD